MRHACRALLAVGFTLGSVAVAQAAETADRIWFGGPILTMNDAAMRAEAVAEKGGRIVAVGTKAEVMKLKGRKTQVVDLQGRTLLPGFVDAHGHVMGGGMMALSANLLAPPDGEVTDIPSLVRTLREWATANAAAVKKANLIIGFGYDNATLAEHRHPTRDDLDQVSTEIPIMLIHQSGHMTALNSKAIQVAGITADTPDPAGGVIRRRPGSREPDGVLEEAAHFPVAVKLLTQVGPEGATAFMRAGAELWARFGFTTAQDGRATSASVAVMRHVARNGGLKVDVVAYPDALGERELAKRDGSLTYVDRFRIGGAKLVIDGSPQGFTAWRDRPYYKPVGDFPPGYRGYAAVTPQQVLDSVEWAYANGVQLLTHANGEAASDLLIAALTMTQLKHPEQDLRPVLIHGQFLREDQVDSYNRLGVIPSLFPMHTYYWGDWHANHTVGPELARNISPTGWVHARGMKFTSHTDAPVAFPDSIRVLSATVTRKARGSGQVIGPDQRVDVVTALKAMTIWSAYQHFEEATKGSIETGKLADFVVLSDDPTAIAPDALENLKVVETIKEGTTIFRMTDEERKRVAVTSGSRSDGFGIALRGMAVERELAALPPWTRTARMRAQVEARSHDASCTGAVLADMVAAMVGTGASAR